MKRVLSSLFVICLLLNVEAENKIERMLKQDLLSVTCGKDTYYVSHFTAKRVGVKDDVIHYVISAMNRPTIVIRHVFSHVTLSIDNTTFCKTEGQSLKFSDDSKKPQYSGIILSKVFAYDDSADKIDLPDDHCIRPNFVNLLDFFRWKLDPSDVKDQPDDTIAFTAFSQQNHLKRSHFHFSVVVRKSEGYQKELPGFPTEANLTQFTFELQNLPSKMGEYFNVSASNLRYAVETVFFTVNKKLNAAKFELKKSIDDEHSPGTFETWATRFPLDQPSQVPKTFVSWKPVAYRDQNPGYENEAFVRLDRYENGANKEIPHDGSLNNYDGNIPWSVGWHPSSSYFALNVTFGQPKDEGYNKKQYMQWSGMVGSGNPPLDVHLSDFAKTVITLGLGGPFVAGFLLAILVFIIRRLRGSNKPKSKYDRIN